MLPRSMTFALFVTLATIITLAVITGTFFVAPRIDSDVRMEAAIVVVVAAAVFALVVWALTPP
jgi:hypothetical protein